MSGPPSVGKPYCSSASPHYPPQGTAYRLQTPLACGEVIISDGRVAGGAPVFGRFFGRTLGWLRGQRGFEPEGPKGAES